VTPERYQVIMHRLQNGQPSSANKKELELICMNLLMPAQAFYDLFQKGESLTVLNADEALEIGKALLMAQTAANERIEQGGHDAINKAFALLKPKKLTKKQT
jgi:hypothetical protein